MDFAWHLFGPDGSGYRTLGRSVGVDDAVSSALERFTWGQTNDVAYLSSLGDSPAFWAERVRGRPELVALTRVFQGESDAEGRSSLKYATLLIPEREWVDGIALSLRSVVADGSLWQFSSDRVRIAGSTAVDADGPGRDSRPGFEHVLRALREHPGTGRSIVLAPRYLTFEQMCQLPHVLNRRERAALSLAFGALSDALPVDLLCLADAHVPADAPHPRVFLKDENGDAVVRVGRTRRPTATAGNAARVESSGSVQTEARVVEASLRPTGPRVEKKPMNRIELLLLAVILALVCVFGTMQRSALHEQATQQKGVLDALQQAVTRCQERLDALTTDRAEDARKEAAAAGEGVASKHDVDAVRERVGTLENKVTEIDGKLTELRRAVDGQVGKITDAIDTNRGTTLSEIKEHFKAGMAKDLAELVIQISGLQDEVKQQQRVTPTDLKTATGKLVTLDQLRDELDKRKKGEKR